MDLFFPGFIFANIDSTACDARKMCSTYGVSNIVRVGDRIGVLPDAFIKEIANYTYEIKNQTSTELTPRQKVVIARGSFVGLITVLVNIDAKHRVKSLFDLIFEKISISLAAEYLQWSIEDESIMSRFNN